MCRTASRKTHEVTRPGTRTRIIINVSVVRHPCSIILLSPCVIYQKQYARASNTHGASGIGYPGTRLFNCLHCDIPHQRPHRCVCGEYRQTSMRSSKGIPGGMVRHITPGITGCPYTRSGPGTQVTGYPDPSAGNTSYRTRTGSHRSE